MWSEMGKQNVQAKEVYSLLYDTDYYQEDDAKQM